MSSPRSWSSGLRHRSSVVRHNVPSVVARCPRSVADLRVSRETSTCNVTPCRGMFHVEHREFRSIRGIRVRRNTDTVGCARRSGRRPKSRGPPTDRRSGGSLMTIRPSGRTQPERGRQRVDRADRTRGRRRHRTEARCRRGLPHRRSERRPDPSTPAGAPPGRGNRSGSGAGRAGSRATSAGRERCTSPGTPPPEPRSRIAVAGDVGASCERSRRTSGRARSTCVDRTPAEETQLLRVRRSTSTQFVRNRGQTTWRPRRLIRQVRR